MQEVRFDNRALGFWFDDVGLGLLLWDGIYEKRHSTWLRWCLADGTVVPAAEEERVQKEAAERRAAQERKDKEAERARADRLAARLRALGIDPNGDD